MPYFVFRISPERKLTLVNHFGKYQEARTTARSLRAEQPAGNGDTIRMIFAEDERKARLLVTDQRTAKTDGDD